jgi:hypothetical protein
MIQLRRRTHWPRAENTRTFLREGKEVFAKVGDEVRKKLNIGGSKAEAA